MPSKMPTKLLLFSVGFFSVMSANADLSYTDLNQCQVAYSTQINRVSADQQNSTSYKTSQATWCQQHMTAANYQLGSCVEQYLSSYATENKTTIDAIRASKTSAFYSACGGTTSSTVAGTTGSTGTTGATGTATTGVTGAGTTTGATNTATPTSAGVPGDPLVAAVNGQQQAAQTVTQQQQAAANAAAQKAAQQQAQQSSSGGGVNPAAMITPLVQMASQMGGNSGSGSSSGSTGDSGTTASGPLNGNTYNTDYNPGATQVTPTDAANAQSQGQAQMDSAKPSLNQNPTTKGASDNVESALKSDAANQPPPTTITQAAQRGAGALDSSTNNVMGVLRKQLCIPVTSDPADKDSAVFKASLANFEQFMGDKKVQDMNACPSSNFQNSSNTASTTGAGNGDSGSTPDKNAVAKFNQERAGQCAPAAEKAEKLCVESDGMKTARTLMDVAGPVLLGLNAAQKQCGAMGDITKFLGGALTAANGLCMGFKIKCESTCKKVISDFSAAHNNFANLIEPKANSDIANITKICQKHDNAAASAKAANNTELATKEEGYSKECYQGLTDRQKVIKEAASRVKEVVGNEQVATNMGTVPSMDALCKDKMRNIVGLASNIGAIALSMMSAKKCEKDLANAAAQGDKSASLVSTQEYCSAAATKDTQFCKCQGNSTAQGCGASVVSSSATDAPADARGIDLKNFGGASGFAGNGALGTGALSYKGAYGADGNPLDPTAQAALRDGTAAAGVAGAGGAIAAGAAVGPDGKPVDAKAADKKTDDKKWSFGSFASSIGGALGFGNSKSEGNGAISPTSKAAIERKLASDRYASEISPSTGADNFAKIKRSYVQKADTFMAAP